ncbi:MAG: hypothetical protein HY303_13910 [Candidatus Wallbacteria bacterium]|nr:hypothetical protein [Candidatus Wallbacteria bacterium]
MASKTKKSEETEAEVKSKKSASKSIKAQKPEKVEKAEKEEREKGEEKAEKVAKRDKAPARKLGGTDTGEIAAAAETRERGHGKHAGEKSTKARSEHAREFHPQEKYKLGEVIYHPAFKEEGKIIEIRKTPEDRDLAVVEFERLGTKRFVFNYSPTPVK